MHTRSIRLLVAQWLALAAVVLAASAFAQQQVAGEADPPSRVGTVTATEGSVVFAAAGETDWSELPRNRPITKGDRLWTDDGGRAEVHFGSSVLHMDSRTFVEVVDVDSDVLQLAVNEGSVNARVRDLRAGDEFEITTPQLALRASQPGDWRLDVDAQRGFTRVAARSGVAVLYGNAGNARQIAGGQQAAFTGRELAQLSQSPPLSRGNFDQWASNRNRIEDQSITARIIPREVVGYQELDQNGTWAQDPTYGAVWYPPVSAPDWAPYRYGHWESIAPWGWTWVDDAPWGFAPFHYGRWIEIGTRWAWVPGPLGRHPVYSPALVAFVGSGANVTVANGPGIGWYPLAPGEIWQPSFAASPVYVRNVNRYLVTDSRALNTGPHYFLRRPDAVTAVRVDDFNRGRPVQQRWARISPSELARLQPASPPAHARAPESQRPRHAQPRPSWRGGEEGGYSRL